MVLHLEMLHVAKDMSTVLQLGRVVDLGRCIPLHVVRPSLMQEQSSLDSAVVDMHPPQPWHCHVHETCTINKIQLL